MKLLQDWKNRIEKCERQPYWRAPDNLDVLEGLDFEEETERDNIDIVMQNLEKYCVGETNEIYGRYCFNKRDQEINETPLCYRSSKASEDACSWKWWPKKKKFIKLAKRILPRKQNELRSESAVR